MLKLHLASLTPHCMITYSLMTQIIFYYFWVYYWVYYSLVWDPCFYCPQIKRPAKESSKSASHPGWITNKSLCQSFGHPLFGKHSPLSSWTLSIWHIHFAVIIVLSDTWLCHQSKLRMLSLFHWRIWHKDATLIQSCHWDKLNNFWREATC